MAELRKLRKHKKLTLAEVSISTGLDVGGLSRIERGEQFPNRATALSLAKYYGISIGAVFDGLPANNANPANK